MKNTITIILLTLMTFTLVAKDTTGTTGDLKLTQLQEIIIESKLLPTPAGVGGNSARFGESVAIDGNRALIGSPTALEHGVAYIFDYDGKSWVETQLIFPDDIDANNRFGNAVSLQGDRALISDKFNRVNGAFQAGAVYVYELNNGEWQQTSKLIASDAGGDDEFGLSVSLSGDRALIGTTNYDDTINGINSGAAYVFDFNGTDWQETVILTATGGTSGDGFGNAVSLNGDMALVGSSNFDENNNAIYTGSAYLFELNTGTSKWSQTNQFLASDGANNDKYGIDVSLSSNKVLIGASDTDESFGATGSAYVYEFDGSLWVETKLLAADAASGDRFGVTVNIENNRLLIGARSGGVIGANTGSAYVFDYNSGTNLWELTDEIFADDITSSGFFASSLALSGDKVIAGNFSDQDSGTQSGAAYVFDLDGTGSWQQSQKLATQGAVGDSFGYAISLDGNRALVGAPYDDDNGTDSGAAYVFDYVNGGWAQTVKLVSSDVYQNFGMALSLSGDKAIIAANRIGFSDSGQAYIFEFNGTSWDETALIESSLVQSDEFGFSVSLYGDRAIVGAPLANENGIKSGSIHVYDLVSTTWQLTDTLTPSDGQLEDLFGTAVSLYTDRMLIGAYSKDDDSNGLSRLGAAYILDYEVGTNMWLETKLQIDDPHSNDFFGSSVDLGDNRAVVGARNGFATGPQRGYAFIYDFDDMTQTWSGVKISASDGGGLDNFGSSVSLDNDKVLIGAYQDDDIKTDYGAAYRYDFDGVDWLETDKYLANDGKLRDYYGWSVSASNGNVLIGVYEANDGGTDSGSAYSYVNELIFADDFEN